MAHFSIACGGTGGHLTPGIALAQRLQCRGHGVTLLTSRKAVDGRLRSKYGHLTFQEIPGSPFSLRPISLLKFFWNFVRAFGQSWKSLKKNRSASVIAFGGFTAFGVCCAAWILRCPIFLHESNSCPGRAIRFLAPLARRVFLPPSLKQRAQFRNRKKFVALGYPLREDFVPTDQTEARRQLGLPLTGRLLAVTGGSQGARILVDWVRSQEGKLADAPFHVVCLTGLDGMDRKIFNRGRDGRFHAVFYVPFCDEMHLLYSAADLAICRAGAGTIAELIHCTTPSILIPYPHAAADHQRMNAAFLSQANGAQLLSQNEMGRLWEVLEEISAAEPLAVMVQNLEVLKKQNGDAAEELADAICRQMD
jgi:UDP-N-acetylglucosamine--N-acetylmuramyl-(pentapeptide) pyrophosphoryl-undecaprenol N-acetylglucosamine transferase